MTKEKIIKILQNTIQAGLILFVFFSPISIAGAQGSLGLIFIAWLIKIFIDKDEKFIRTPLDIPILVFLFASLLSVFFSIDFFNSLKHFRSMWTVLAFFLVVNTIKDRASIRKLFLILITVTTIVSIYGIFQHYLGIDLTRPVEHKVIGIYGNTFRALGTFNHHLTFSGYILIVLSINLSLFLFSNTVKEKLFLGGILLIIGLTLLFTFARSAWLGFIGAALFLGIFSLRINGKNIFLKIFVSLFIISLISAISPPIRERAKTIIDADANSERIYLWQASLKMFKDYPLTGAGIHSFGKLYNNPKLHYRNPNSEGNIGEAHNVYLHMLATRGVLGFLSFVCLWIVFFKTGFYVLTNIDKADIFSKSLLLGIMSSIFGFLIAGLFETNFNDSEVVMLVWFLIGIIMVFYNQIKDKEINYQNSSEN